MWEGEVERVGPRVPPRPVVGEGETKIPQRGSKIPQRHPKIGPREPKIAPRGSKIAPRGPKIVENFEIVESYRNKIDYLDPASHSPWSFAMVKSHSQRSNPNGGGGGRAKRSSIRHPRPKASKACCGCFSEAFFQKLSSRVLDVVN